jgi:hypothetical protein
MASVAVALLGVVCGNTSRAQCDMELNKVNIDCAMPSAIAIDNCEFIELKVTGFSAGTTANNCGYNAITVYDAVNCGTPYLEVTMFTSRVIAQDGLFVIAGSDTPGNVDWKPATWSEDMLPNTGSFYIELIGRTNPTKRWLVGPRPAAATCWGDSNGYTGLDIDAERRRRR